MSDCLGKVVYIDFWATNCAPCVQELPATKRLQTQFMNKGDVVFLYVSFDQSNTRAIEFIKDREFKGVHLFDTKGFNSEVAMKYNIQSIPRYVLIDKQGQLISDKGPRPSAHPEEMIRNALSK